MLYAITLRDGTMWACSGFGNDGGDGLLTRSLDGTWYHVRGTSQTPVFRSARALSRYVHRNYREISDGARLPRMISSYGWKEV